MTATTATVSPPAQQGTNTGVTSKPKAAPRSLTLEEFRRKYSNREDGYKYEFVIEIISPTDRSVKVEEKVLEYFEAGVKVVWLLFPKTQTVHVYTSPISVIICRGDRVCSAAPVVVDFEIRAEEVFAKKM